MTMLFIKLRASNAIALMLIIIAFYLDLRGITLAKAWQALSGRGDKAIKDAKELVETQIPKPVSEPMPSPPILDPRLKNANPADL